MEEQKVEELDIRVHDSSGGMQQVCNPHCLPFTLTADRRCRVPSVLMDYLDLVKIENSTQSKNKNFKNISDINR